MLCSELLFWPTPERKCSQGLGSKLPEVVHTKLCQGTTTCNLSHPLQVGGEAFITKQSQSLYKTSASGRINCIGLEATIDLQARNDLVSVLYGKLF